MAARIWPGPCKCKHESAELYFSTNGDRILASRVVWLLAGEHVRKKGRTIQVRVPAGSAVSGGHGVWFGPLRASANLPEYISPTTESAVWHPRLFGYWQANTSARRANHPFLNERRVNHPGPSPGRVGGEWRTRGWAWLFKRKRESAELHFSNHGDRISHPVLLG